MHLRPMYFLFLILSEQSIALRAPAVHGVSSLKVFDKGKSQRTDTHREQKSCKQYSKIKRA